MKMGIMKHISTLIKNMKKKSKGIRNGISMVLVTAILLSVLSMAALAAPITGTVTVPAGVTSFSIDLVVDEATPFAGIEFELQISGGGSVNVASFIPTYTGVTPSPFGQRAGWHFFGFFALSNAFSSGKVGTVNFTGYTGNQELTITVKMTVVRIIGDGRIDEIETNPSHVFTVQREESPHLFHTVTFNPFGGTRIGGGELTQLVLHGGAAAEPILAQRAGYTFLGWDKAFTNVTEDLAVTARWEPIYHTVTFDPSGGTRTGGGELIQTVIHGGSAVEPIVARDGYAFVRWEGSYTNVTANVTVTAVWTAIPVYHTVTFDPSGGTRTGGGELTQQVLHGGAAVAPELIRDGYDGPNWDNPFNNVTSDMTVTAQWVSKGDNDPPSALAIGATVIKGNSVYVPIELVNNPGLVTMRLTVTFDDRYVTLSPGSVIDGGLLGNTYHSDHYNSPYTLFWDNSTAHENFMANGTIATLKFTVSGDAPDGEYDITLSYDYDLYDIMDCDMNPVRFETIKGVLKVVPFVCGDLTGKGYVDEEDAELLAKYLGRYEDITIIEAAADLDQDGSITPKDLAILRRHLDGWAGYETLPYKP